MKNTYKLIGVFWDGKPAADLPAALRPYDPEYLKAGSPPCLFDLAGKRRRVNLSRLLDISGQSDLDSLVDELAGCRSVAVMLDYLPRAEGGAHKRFFLHRASQAIGAVSRRLPGAEVVLMAPPEEAAA